MEICCIAAIGQTRIQIIQYGELSVPTPAWLMLTLSLYIRYVLFSKKCREKQPFSLGGLRATAKRHHPVIPAEAGIQEIPLLAGLAPSFYPKVLITHDWQRLYKWCHGCAAGSSVQARV
jgi:hypothetical protein